MEFDFSLPVASIDAVPAEFRALYVEKDGKHVINDTMGAVVGAVTGMNKTIKATRAENETLRKGAVDLSALSEFGATPADIKAAFDARVAELTTKGGDKAQAIEAVRKEMAAANAKAVEGATKQSEALRGQLYTHLVRNAATAAISELKGVPELLLPFVEKSVRVVDNEGVFTPTVVNDAGEQRYGATGQPMTIKELVSEMKGNAAVYGRLFDSDKQAGGGGANPGGGRAAPQTGAGVKTSNAKIAAGLTALRPR